MKLNKETLNQIESDFAKVRKADIAKRNNTNKARSRRQELEVAKFLGAHRVPMSGAGMMKGDGLWYTPHGLLLYECKYSAAHHAKYGWAYRLSYEILAKMQKDTESMKARFGFLVVHFFNQIGGTRWGTVLIRREDIEPFMKPEWLADVFEYEYHDGRVATRIYYNEIRNCYRLNRAFPCAQLLTPSGPYVILPLWAFKEIIAGKSDDNSSDPGAE